MRKSTQPNPTDRPVPYSEGWQSPVTPGSRSRIPVSPPSRPGRTRQISEQAAGRPGEPTPAAPIPPRRPAVSRQKTPGSRAANGDFLSDEELRRPDNLELGPKRQHERANQRRITERTFLRQLVVEASKDGNMTEIVQRLIADAKNGDKDAMKLVSRVLWGGGKVPLDDIYHTPMIRKSRR